MWLVQYAGMRPENTDEVMSVLKAKNIPFKAVGIRPFTTELMGLDESAVGPEDTSGLMTAYGSCKMIRLVRELGIEPGIYFDESSFNVMAWNRFLPNEMANPSLFASVREFRELGDSGKDHEAFIRPVMDLKLFSGGVKPAGTTWNDFITDKLNGATRYENVILAMAEPKPIDGEWRCFVVNRQVVTASQYRINGELKPSPDVPAEVIRYANNIGKLWLPHDHCTVDIAMIDGQCKVMEFNCINASGLYKADSEKFVDALNSLMV